MRRSSHLHAFRPLFALLLCLLLNGCMDLLPKLNNLGRETANKNPDYRGEVYTMRGGLGGIFSTGMSDLQRTLQTQYHIQSASTIWFKQDDLSTYIIKHYRAHELQTPIVLIGHSLGANEQIKVARELGRANIPVALLITVDAVAPIKVSANVQHAINIYKPGYVPMFSGIRLVAENPTLTRIDNLNVDKLEGISVNHFTIDKNSAVQDLMLKNVLAVLKKPGKHS
ncbi:hypothetical protein [Legionella sp. CNM-4043-24]|uniref:hypothetical protein n=1 Tax=Legionella sp. CNM-4043-24 TaxID=3421646 RepID=UPI00403A86D5